MAGCCTACARDKGSVGASGIMWDRGDAGATDTGSTRPRHDNDVRAKCKGGMAIDNGVGGMAVDGSMGMQRASSGGARGGVMDMTGRVHGV